MKKKFTHLISCCFAMLLLGSGTAWGQTWQHWGTGSCDHVSGGYTHLYNNLGDEDGIYIGGHRGSGWDSWASGTVFSNTWNSTTVGSCTTTMARDEARVYWNGTAWVRQTRRATYSRSCTGSGTCSCTSWTDDGVAWSVGTAATGTWTGGNMPSGNFGVDVPCPYDSHVHTIEVDVTGGAQYSPLHFKQFYWGQPTWRHTRTTYSISWANGVATISRADDAGSPTHGDYAKPLTIELRDGADVRLHGGSLLGGASAQWAPMVDSTHSSVNPYFVLGGNNSLRFDTVFTGTAIPNANVSPAADANLPLAVGGGTVYGLGFWAGTTQSHTIDAGGFLWIGPNGLASGATLSPGSGVVTVENYIQSQAGVDWEAAPRTTDNADGAPTAYHNVLYNIPDGNITASASGTIIVQNANMGNCSDGNAQLLVLGSNIGTRHLTGNLYTRAHGNVIYQNDLNASQSGVNFEIRSTRGSINTEKFEYTNTNTNGFLYIHTGESSNNCCSSINMLNTKLGFIGDNGAATILSRYAGIFVDGTFDYTATTATPSNNKLDVLGAGGINIKDSVTMNIKDDGHARLYSQNSSIILESILKQIQTGTPTGNFGFSLIANGACDNGICLPGGYVLVDGSISTTNVEIGSDTIQSVKDQIYLNAGIAYAGADSVLLIDGFKSVNINGRHDGTTPALPSGVILGAAGGGNEGVYIRRDGRGNDRILSDSGHIYVASPFTYWQTSANHSGLTVWAQGDCDAATCLGSGAIVGGYVQIDSSVTTSNDATGFVTLQSKNHHVTLGHGMVHTGFFGELNILGHTYVDINAGHHRGTAATTNPAIALPTVLDSVGLYIYRQNIANDNVISSGGHIYVQQPLTYHQMIADNTGLTVNAKGTDCAIDCVGDTIHGYVQIDNAVTTTNVTTGFTTIKSDLDYVEMNNGFAHTGVDGNLLVAAQTRVDINNPYPAESTHSTASIALPKTSGAREGLYILRTGIGRDSISANAGHVNITNPVTFVQSGGTAGSTGNGFHIWANGDCDEEDCHNNTVGGYVWLRNDVNTTNLQHGPTAIISNSHYIRIGENSPSNDSTGGHFIHQGVDGDLSILAGTNIAAGCTPICTPVEDTLQTVNQNANIYLQRGFVWIGDDVNITMNGTAGTEGHAVIRSYGDIIQMNDSVTFTDKTGANLWVDGYYGIRTLGPTTLTNNAFVSGTNVDARGVRTSSPADYRTSGHGYVTYLSPMGYVDFGVAPLNNEEDDPSLTGGNTPFSYTATANENALLIEGHSRVFFGDSVTIKMGTGATAGIAGNAKIYSPAGWIKFADTMEFTGALGSDFIIYANGGVANIENQIYKRSTLNPALTCATERGGFVLFDSLTQINYAAADTGRTWIRSQLDDVVMGDMFVYKSAEPASHNGMNGEFIMQAGQDIYGKSFEDTIHFVQQGDSSILLEAKKTIHLQQMLHVDRDAAVQGDITLKAGYPTFAEPASIMGSNAASYKDNMPSAALAGLNWLAKGDCNPVEYTSRFAGDETRNVLSPGSMQGGDIWFEGRVWVDLTKTKSTDKTIATTLRAFNSIFIDSTFVYDQDTLTHVGVNDNVLLFAEMGNIEAIVTRQDKLTFPTVGYVADDTVRFAFNENFEKEFRMQAGNQVWAEGNENSTPTNLLTCWNLGCDPEAEFDGNILYNKPFLFNHKGTGYSIISAARDIETQVMAPFVFTYDGGHATSGDLDITAGRHIETHAMMQFNYPDMDDVANITLQAGRLTQEQHLSQTSMTASDLLCKTTEVGTTLTDVAGTKAFDPDVETGGVNGAVNNSFAAGGKGQGSILVFDSLEFNYRGEGNILMTALNGNIESDPYLHRTPGEPANPGQGGATGNWGDGYMPYDGFTLPIVINPNDVQHDAQITFNHGGTGAVTLEAIDIKLHDKIAYYGQGHATRKNGNILIHAFDSILTRNIEYVNLTDNGSIQITSDKYKFTGNNHVCTGSYCDLTPNCAFENIPIQQGHIVLGYGADPATPSNYDEWNMNDSIVFNFAGNTTTSGANVLIRAGYEGYRKNVLKGQVKTDLFTTDADKGKGYGGNITFDYIHAIMAKGNGTAGGYMEISTPNGNIWGKDSMYYYGIDGNLLVDAGVGSIDDPDALRWNDPYGTCASGKENTLNTKVPLTCDDDAEWRTGNIMMKGAYLNFQDGKGNATFRTREGYIDTYDAFTVDSMRGNLLKYAATESGVYAEGNNQWGDVSERDFQYTPIENSGSVFFGADDNIMMNYGYNNATEKAYEGRGEYNVSNLLSKPFTDSPLTNVLNPFYSTSYKPSIDAYRSVFNVNENGYMWYHSEDWAFTNSHGYDLHRMFRGCSDNGVCSPNTGDCVTSTNFARDLILHFDYDQNGTGTNRVQSGGFAAVATNYIDMFTKFEYYGGNGSGLHSVPGMGQLHGENVQGYGLYMKSQFNGVSPESRRATCEDCNEKNKFQIQGRNSADTYEWTYIGFHDDARIHTHDQKSLLEAPVIEFFGHAELDAFTERGGTTKLTLKADSLIFHDSAIFDGKDLELLPYTTGTQRTNDMRYGVINDDGPERAHYSSYGPAIEMEDRNVPVLELGYQRCVVPERGEHQAPNARSLAKLETTPRVGGDIIVAVKHDFSLPIFNTVVANHARISFISDSIDLMPGGEYVDACVRTDLLRIRNKVEFYTDPAQSKYRRGVLKMTTKQQMPTTLEAGIYPRHLHLEPNSELSIPGEDSLLLIGETTVGGYGNFHENIFARANSILAPGYASLMESDCATPKRQGKLTIHNLKMQQDAELRISIGRQNCQRNPATGKFDLNCVQTDTLVVQDSVFMWGRIPLVVLPESEFLSEGCYLFMEYGDSLGVSKEYVKNLYLVEDRYGEYYMSLNFSEPGKVYLCISSYVLPEVQRYVDIPSVNGVTTNPSAGRHYVKGSSDFTFTATFSDSPLEVTALGYYSAELRNLDRDYRTFVSGSTYQYVIKGVVQPWTVYIGPNPSTVSNDGIEGQRVWAHKNTLYINVDVEDIVSIYNMTGVLYKKVEVVEGLNTFLLDRGVYVITLKDGSVHKIVIK